MSSGTRALEKGRRMLSRDAMRGMPHYPRWARKLGRAVDKHGSLDIWRDGRRGLRFRARLVLAVNEEEKADVAHMLKGAGAGKVRAIQTGPRHFRIGLNEVDTLAVLLFVGPFLTHQVEQARLVVEVIHWKQAHGPFPRTLHDMDYCLSRCERLRTLNHQGNVDWPLFAA